MILPEVQRLLARGHGSLPHDVLVDVSAIMRWAGEEGASFPDAMIRLEEAATRTHRRLLWVVAPTAFQSLAVSHMALAQEAQRLQTNSAYEVLRSAQPLLRLLDPVLAAPFDIGIVTAGLEQHERELVVLDWLNGALLDVASGRLRTYLAEYHEGHEPIHLPLLAEVVGSPPDSKPLTRDAPSRRDELESALRQGHHLADAKVPQWLVQKIRQMPPSVRTGPTDFLPTQPTDNEALTQLQRWLEASPVYIARTQTKGVHLLPFFRRVGDTLEMRGLFGQADGEAIPTPSGERRIEEALRSLVRDHPDRWFVSHALDLLGWMADRGLPLPGRVVDPAFVAFTLNPDEPVSLAESCPSVSGLPAEVVEWLEDVERKTEPPPSVVLADNVLAQLDVELRDLAAQEGMTAIVEDDLAPTMPVLARVERQGPRVGVPRGFLSWKQVRANVIGRLQSLEPAFRPMLDWIDPYDDKLTIINRRFARKVPIDPAFRPRWMKPSDEFARYVANGFPPARALEEARSIATTRGSLSWLDTLWAAKGRLRGRLVPQVSGRFGSRQPDVQNLPKRSDEGKLLRSALRAPLGYLLFDADFDGFEARILAGLSGDANLLRSCATADVHSANATLLFGSASKGDRSLAKAAFLAIAYDQTSDGFVRAQPKMRTQDAQALYQTIKRTFAGVTSYRDLLVAAWRSTPQQRVISPCGWRRTLEKRQAAKVLNAVVQSLAATIFRRALRALDRSLKTLDAFMLQQVHDEVVIAVRPHQIETAESLVTVAMQTAADLPSPLLSHPVPFVVRLRRGRSWADFL